MFPASEYFRSLSAADQQRYSGKLLVYGVQRPDPYGISDSEWVHDAAAKRLCPPVKMTNVVIYLLFSPSEFTPENVENHKSLQAYSYFQSGLVRKCRIWRSNAKKICIVRAEVMPSPTASARGHDVWLCVDRSSGQVRTFKEATNVQGLLDSILQRRPPLNVDSIKWGQDNERTAKEQYLEFMKSQHQDFELHDIGFVIDRHV
ncbi:hypothetical protein MTO96_042499 [Rhipicephalus appendiculatus]